MWPRKLRAASSRAAGVLPEPRGSVLGTRAAHFEDVPQGTRVRIIGIARELDRMLISPVDERPCLAFRLVVEEPGWRLVLERTGCTSFLVQDGDVAVRIEGPFRVLLHTDYAWDFGNDVQQRIARLLEADRLARRTRESRFERLLRALSTAENVTVDPKAAETDAIYCENYRYFEALIRPGDRVAVEGFAALTVDPGGARAALREPPLLHALTGTTDRPVTIFVPEPGRTAP
jgi:hypothetical protein